MRAAWGAWKKAFSLGWENLVKLIGINLLWLSVSWLIIPIGPAIFATYWWVARSLRDEDESMKRLTIFYTGFRRFFWRGLLWSLGWVAVLLLAWTSLSVWPRLLPPMGTAIAEMLWLYALIFLAAMQPYLLEALTLEERPWGEAMKRAAWQVLANPIYSHLQLLIPIIALVIGFKFATLIPVVLVAVVMTFFAVAAQECPWKHGEPPPNRARIEDVL